MNWDCSLDELGLQRREQRLDLDLGVERVEELQDEQLLKERRTIGGGVGDLGGGWLEHPRQWLGA